MKFAVVRRNVAVGPALQNIDETMVQTNILRAIHVMRVNIRVQLEHGDEISGQEDGVDGAIAGGGEARTCSAQQKRKRFFFEKKEAKNLWSCGMWECCCLGPQDKVFLLLFVHKKKCLLCY
jgi:riboflavin synthase alpha subunit